MVKSKFYNLDTDTTLSENSDLYIPSQKATKTYIDTIASGKANVGLDNLNADGQMIIDSQNGTISNCILEIPQNIKISISNNVITLASGSVVTLTGYNTYTTRTTTADITKDSWISSWYNKTVLLYIGSTGTWFGFKEVSKVGSGSSLPADNTNFDDFYLTTDYSWYEWENSTWSKKNFSYPLAIVNIDSNGVASFAKDSNGNDMIFNGAGFIGHHAFVYPNVEVLIPNGIDTDGSLKNILSTTNALIIKELTASVSNRSLCINQSGGVDQYTYLGEIDSFDDIIRYSWALQYCKKENVFMRWNPTAQEYQQVTAVRFFSYVTSGTTVTDFTIQQPVRLATTEMLDKKQDTLISGTNIKTINNESILGSGNIDLANFAWGSITGTLSDQTDLQNALDAKANDNNVVHKTGDETITGTKTVSGTSFKVTNEDQFKLLTYDTRIDRGVVPSAWTDMFPYLLVGKNNKRLSGLYCSYAQDMKNQISLIAYKGTSTDASDYSAAQIDVGYDGSTRAYAKAPIPFEDTTSSTQIDTVGARNTKLQNYVPTSRKINNKALTSDITLTASDVGALPSSTTINDLTTTAQQNALNSGITFTDVTQITTNKNNISTINGKIPSAATTTNQLADKSFVNSSISTNTAYFIGTFNSVADLEAYSGTLTNNDYAFVISTDSAGNTVYNRYKYTTATNPASWQFEYALNNSSFTADQWAAINSGATTTNIGQITTNQNAIGTLSSLTTTEKSNLVGAINELDSDKVDANTAITGATKCKITYDSKGLVTAGANLAASDIPNLASNKTTAMTGYSKATGSNAIATSDSLNTAIGKLEYKADNAVVANSAITGATKCKITYDSKGLVTAGANLSASDIPSLTLSKISDVTATASELNVLDGITATTAELNYTDGVTSNIQTQLNAKAADNAVVKLTGDQIITGTKTFNTGPKFRNNVPNSLTVTSNDEQVLTSTTTNSSGIIDGSSIVRVVRYNANGENKRYVCYRAGFRKSDDSGNLWPSVSVGVDTDGKTFGQFETNRAFAPIPTTTTSTGDTYIATTGWVNSRLNTVGGNYVTLDTTQTISGAKTFSSPITIGSSTLTYNSTTQALEFSFA